MEIGETDGGDRVLYEFWSDADVCMCVAVRGAVVGVAVVCVVVRGTVVRAVVVRVAVDVMCGGCSCGCSCCHVHMCLHRCGSPHVAVM